MCVDVHGELDSEDDSEGGVEVVQLVAKVGRAANYDGRKDESMPVNNWAKKDHMSGQNMIESEKDAEFWKQNGERVVICNVLTNNPTGQTLLISWSNTCRRSCRGGFGSVPP